MKHDSIAGELGEAVRATRGLFALEVDIYRTGTVPALSEDIAALHETVLDRLERAAALVEQVELERALDIMRAGEKGSNPSGVLDGVAAVSVSPDVAVVAGILGHSRAG